jgi:ABC-type Fe3+ transport system substrate-binding protein
MNRLHRCLGAALTLLTLATGHARADDALVVMTSYPEAVVNQFEAAFAKRHPEYPITIRWRMPDDALATLQSPDHGGIDVYWSPATRNFAALAVAGALQRLTLDRQVLPRSIGTFPIADAQDRYTASEIAGYGLFVNADYLTRHRLPEPHDWQDLAAPAFAGHVAFPVPARIGYAPMLVEGWLQVYGWEAGWTLVSELAAGARLVDRRGNFITDEVSSGRAGVGLTMDFFAASALAGGAPGRFVYPAPVFYNPAHIGILAGAPHPEAARAFVDFVLSDEGQRLLFHPDIRKLPVRPAVYADAPAGYHNPFTVPAAAYDLALGDARRDVDAALFEVAITHRKAQLAALWQALHEAEAKAPSPAGLARLAQARRLLGAMPVDADQARDPALQNAAAGCIGSLDAAPDCAALEARWGSFFDANYAAAKQLVESAAP